MAHGAVTAAGGSDGTVALDVHIDPMCPYAHQTSVWLRAVRGQRDVTVRWRFFSLEEINRVEGHKHPWERDWSYGWSQMRVGALVRRRHGEDGLDRWYAGVGRAFHEEGRRTHVPDEHRELLDELGLGAALVDEALADPTTGEEVRADHDEVVGRHGGFGVPTLVFDDGQALFGPVVVPPPLGEEAGRLWDLVVGWRAFPHLYELRRPKTDADVAHIAEAFRPYLEARDWRTVENPAR
jgi:hypothetical protein